MNTFRRVWHWSELVVADQELLDQEEHIAWTEEQLRTELFHLHQELKDMGYLVLVRGREPHGCDCGEWEQHSFLLVDDLGTMVYDVLVRELVLAPNETVKEDKDEAN